MIEILTLTFKIIIILFFVGYGFTSLFIPERLRSWINWLSPWSGIILISFLGVICSLTNIAMKQTSQIILLLAFILLLAALFTKKVKFGCSKNDLIMATLTLGLLIFSLYPLMARGGFPTTISLGNLDPVSYSTTGDWLINHTVSQPKKQQYFKPYLASIGDLVYYSYRWGSPLILSFFASIFSLQSFQIFSILITILFSLSWPLVYILATEISSKKQPYLLPLIFIGYGLNSILLYVLFNVFFGQFVFSGVFIFTLILLFSYASETKTYQKGLNAYDVFIALGLASISSIYPEGLVFAFVPIVIFTLFHLFNKKSRKIQLACLVKITLLATIISPVTIGRAIYQIIKVFFVSADTGFIGWEKIAYANPLEIMGFYNLFYSRHIPEILGWLIGGPIVAFWLLGIKKIKEKRLVLSYLLMFLIFGFGYRFVINNFYAYFRLISYSVFIYVILFSIGLNSWLATIKSRLIKLIIIFSLLSLSLRSAHRTIAQHYWHSQIIDESLISLNELNQASIDQPFFTDDVYLGDYSLWKRFWREYFLTNQKIVTHNNYASNQEHIKLVLGEKNNLTVGNKTLVYKTIIWQNQYYQLGEIEDLEVSEDLIVK